MKNTPHNVITGGGSGLGLGLALRLLGRGENVSILNRTLTDDAKEELNAAATAGSGSWLFIATNICDERSVHDGVNQAVKAYGAAHLAINSAGIGINKSFANTPCAEFRNVIDVNLNGSCHFAAAVLPLMQPGSRLVLIASIAGLLSNYGYSAYGASKFGVVGLATALKYEYEPLGIGISCVCPPEVRTPMVAAERSPGNADPISLGLKDIAGTLDIDYACGDILKGIDKGRWMIVSGPKARASVFVARHFPSVFFTFMKLTIRRLMRRHGMLSTL